MATFNIPQMNTSASTSTSAVKIVPITTVTTAQKAQRIALGTAAVLALGAVAIILTRRQRGALPNCGRF